MAQLLFNATYIVANHVAYLQVPVDVAKDVDRGLQEHAARLGLEEMGNSFA